MSILENISLEYHVLLCGRFVNLGCDIVPQSIIPSSDLTQVQLSLLFSQDHYNTVTEALSIFKDDPLLSVPGTSYFYTTHGWTLLTAVIEGASNQDFLPYMKKLFKELGMENTCAEFNDRIIYNRARLC